VTETIIPLPIVRAAASVEAARAIAAKESRTQEDQQAIAAELQKARDQIELAQALGYATKKELEDLLDAIKELERETSGGSAATSFFERIRGLFANARESSQPQGTESDILTVRCAMTTAHRQEYGFRRIPISTTGWTIPDEHFSSLRSVLFIAGSLSSDTGAHEFDKLGAGLGSEHCLISPGR
jgi:hypothetical protein